MNAPIAAAVWASPEARGPGLVGCDSSPFPRERSGEGGRISHAKRSGGGESLNGGTLDAAEYLRLVAQIGEWVSTPDGRSEVERIQRENGSAKRHERRAKAFRLQRAMRPIFDVAAPARTAGLSPMAKCGWTRISKDGGVDVRVDVEGHAGFRGVASCGRRTCPVCGPRLLARDSELVEAGVEEHGYDRTLMSTMTVRHWRGHGLRALRRGIVKAWGDLQRQRAFRELLEFYGAHVFVRVLETTHGENGWHVHYHVLVFANRDLSDYERASFDAAWSAMWREAVERVMGRAHRPTLRSGVLLTRCHRADYLTKLGIGAEVTDVGRAKGRTYWAIANEWLDAGADLEAPAARLLFEYVRDMRAAVIVAWPRKGEFTRRKLDERHPEEKPEERETSGLHSQEWDALRRVPDGRARLLEAAERAPVGTVDQAVRDILDELLEGHGRGATERHSWPASVSHFAPASVSTHVQPPMY